jgi:hypothetical protein
MQDGFFSLYNRALKILNQKLTLFSSRGFKTIYAL